MGRLQKLTHMIDRVAEHLMSAAAILLLMMVILINIEVAGRYLFGFSTLISDEYSGYLFSWIVMLGLLYALRNDRLLRVDAIYLRFPKKVRHVMDVLNAILGAFLCGILTYAVWKTFWLSWLFQSKSNHASETYLYLIQFMMVFGIGILTFAFIEQAVRLIVSQGRSPADNIRELKP